MACAALVPDPSCYKNPEVILEAAVVVHSAADVEGSVNNGGGVYALITEDLGQC